MLPVSIQSDILEQVRIERIGIPRYPTRRLPTPRQLCAICAIPLAQHLRCAGCEFLVGPEHEQKELIGTLCTDCRRNRLARQQRRRSRAQEKKVE